MAAVVHTARIVWDILFDIVTPGVAVDNKIVDSLLHVVDLVADRTVVEFERIETEGVGYKFRNASWPLIQARQLALVCEVGIVARSRKCKARYKACSVSFVGNVVSVPFSIESRLGLVDFVGSLVICFECCVDEFHCCDELPDCLK